MITAQSKMALGENWEKKKKKGIKKILPILRKHSPSHRHTHQLWPYCRERYTDLAQHRLGEAEHEGLPSWALWHKTEGPAAGPTPAARGWRGVNRRDTVGQLGQGEGAWWGVIAGVYHHWPSLTKGWLCSLRQMYFKNLFPNVNGISSHGTGNLKALAALTFILVYEAWVPRAAGAEISREVSLNVIKSQWSDAKPLTEQSREKGAQGESRL